MPRLNRGGLSPIGVSLLLLLAITAVYWPIFNYPFIQDDWAFLYLITQHADAGFLAQLSLLPSRPLAVAYFILVHRLFGFQPTGFHVLGVLLHFFASLLVVRVVLAILGDELLAWATGFLYATAITVHMDPMLWLVGFFAHGGAFFCLLSFAWFLTRRDILSSLASLAALLTVETSLFLPLLLWLHAFQAEDYASSRLRRAGLAFRRLRFHFLGLLLYLGLSARTLLSLLTSPPDYPYATAFAGPHLLKNLVLYTVWGFQAVLPLKEALFEWVPPHLAWLDQLPGLSFWFLLSALCLVLVLLARCDLRQGLTVLARHRVPVLLVAWVLLGLAPVFFLRHHTYRYYLMHSLPGIAVLSLLSIRTLARRLRWQTRQVAGAILILTLLDTGASSAYFYRRTAEGLEQRFTAGTNALIRRGTTVRLISSSLSEILPSLPPGANLVFSGVDTWSFSHFAGPRLWYHDDTLRVYRAEDLTRRSGGLYSRGEPGEALSGMPPGPERYLDPEKTAIVELRDGRLWPRDYATVSANE